MLVDETIIRVCEKSGDVAMLNLEQRKVAEALAHVETLERFAKGTASEEDAVRSLKYLSALHNWGITQNVNTFTAALKGRPEPGYSEAQAMALACSGMRGYLARE